MFVIFLFGLSLGIEGGYTQPANGFDYVQNGTALSVYGLRETAPIDIELALHLCICAGDNPGYSLNFYGLNVGILKTSWLFSPVIECGLNYATHALGSGRETGYVFNYTFGLALNFRVYRVRIYPLCYYEGLTDFKKQAGFVGIKLGIGYEI